MLQGLAKGASRVFLTNSLGIEVISLKMVHSWGFIIFQDFLQILILKIYYTS